MPFINLSAEDRRTLVSLARESIRVRLLFDRDLRIDEIAFSPALQQWAASFVTLKIHGKLRGCIGTLEARQPLVQDVVHNAAAAALDDPRFPPLTLEEESETSIDISVLTVPEPLQFTTEDELLAQLSPGVDGLTIEAGVHRSTFLPSVWGSLPDKAQFLRQLKLKAGMELDISPSKLKAWRYQADSFGE